MKMPRFSTVTRASWWLFFLVLWIVPLGTSFAFFMVLWQIVQHGNADQERFTNTRVFLVNRLISMAVFPIAITIICLIIFSRWFPISICSNCILCS